jgi:uncharacterized protein (TIGR03118 family)
MASFFIAQIEGVIFMGTYRILSRTSAVAGLLLLATNAFAGGEHSHRYVVRNLVSDGGVTADHIDPALVNAWGIAFNPLGFVWVANNGTSTSTLYDGNGVKNPLTVAVPGPAASPGKPTGIVYSASADFAVTLDGKTGPSRFIFAGESGTVSGWAPTVNTTNAVLAYTALDGAIYKGLALGSNGTANFLYAADFHNNKIDVLDRTFTKVTLAGIFRDPHLPLGYAPFGIQNILGNIYVLFAKQDGDAEDEIAGPGLGFVSVFDTNGNFLRRLISRGALNAAWGIALAPADFGRFSNRLLIGNFGDGRINAYDLASGNFVGELRDTHGHALKVDGLWGLSFGNGVQNQPTSALFVTAGPNDESSGLYARIEAVNADDNDDDDDHGHGGYDH